LSRSHVDCRDYRRRDAVSRFDSDDCDENFNNEGLLWWANVERHIKGAKGQAVLREIRDVLRAMPEKVLLSSRLADEKGHVCAVGAVALARRVAKGESRDDVLCDLARKIPEDDTYNGADITASVGVAVGLKYGLAWALGDANDGYWKDTPEERYERVLAWVEKNIQPEPVAA
jgi:hypothetical protein